MSATQRNQVINKLFKVAKKHFQPVSPPASRNVLDHLLYACCLENSTDVAADEAFARLEQNYFDWNEVRVTTTHELAESLKGLTDPEAAALSLKKALHSVFETWYKFDLDFLKKENLRKTEHQLSKFRGVSPFVVSYTVQVALGGHFIPLDESMLNLMLVLGIVSEAELAKERVPGLERAIPKSKGIEFTSVVHQLAVALFKSPNNKGTRSIITSIAPDAKDRFPKRGAGKKVPAAESELSAAADANGSESRASDKSIAGKSVKSTGGKKVVLKKKSPATKKKVTESKKDQVRKIKTPAKKSMTTKKTTAKKAGRPAKKSASRSLTRKKPR